MAAITNDHVSQVRIVAHRITAAMEKTIAQKARIPHVRIRDSLDEWLFLKLYHSTMSQTKTAMQMSAHKKNVNAIIL